MPGQLLREHFNSRFFGMSRFSRWGAYAMVGLYLGQALAGVWIGSYLLDLPVSWETLVAMIATSIFIGTRLRGLNNIVHECSHSSFAQDRQDNVALGKLCSAILTGCFTKYKKDHLSHHMHLGDYERDNELGPIRKFRLHEALTGPTILRHIITPLLGRHLRTYSGVNFSGADGAAFLGLKIFVMLAIMGYAVMAPLAAIFFVLIPLFYIFPTLNFWTDCLDHAGLVGAKDELEASRNVLAPAPVRLLFFPRNDCYHLVHHLFPNVPARHLAEAHRILCEDTEYRRNPLAAGPAALRPEDAPADPLRSDSGLI